jgi:uncharacterized repeat protein (TIGR03803 family)
MQNMFQHPRSFFIATLSLSWLTLVPAVAQFSIVAEFPQQLIRPTSGLVRGPNLVNANVRLYGVSEFGGTAGGGVLFMYEPATNTVTQLVDFGRDFGTVAAPATSSGRIGSGEHRLAVDGNVVYGVAREGGGSGQGCVWKWAPTLATPNPRPELLGSFERTSTGAYPTDGLVIDGGVLYGVCAEGPSENGAGTVWKMAATGGTISILHEFQDPEQAGEFGLGGRIGGIAVSDGWVYGYARRIDAGVITDVVYSDSTTVGGTASIERPINRSFDAGGGYPSGRLVTGPGALNFGILHEFPNSTGRARVFRLDGDLTNKVLPGTNHGKISLSPASFGVDIVTESGSGAAANGALYRWETSRATLITLGEMSVSGGSVKGPSGSIYLDSTDAIFGTCEGPTAGAIWKLGLGASPTVVARVSFVVPALGGRPNGIVARSNGDIIGYEAIGQSLWRYNPAAAGSGLGRLASFSFPEDVASLGTLTVDGNGEVTSVSSDGDPSIPGGKRNAATIDKSSGVWTWSRHGGLRSRLTSPPAEEVTGGVVNDAVGNTFGTSNNFANAASITGPLTTLWKLTPGNTRAVVAVFSKTTQGTYAFGPIVMGADGAIYGICLMGGTGDGGTLWKWTQAGGLTQLFAFQESSDFRRPHGGLIVRSDGSLYGTSGAVTAETARVWRFTPGDVTPMVRHGNIAKAAQGQYFENDTGFTGIQKAIIAVLAPVVERSGVLHGVTDFGAANGCGSLWTISLGGTSPATVSTAHSFRRSTAAEGKADGGRGLFSLAIGADNRVYGVGDDALWAFGTPGARPPSLVTNPILSSTATSLTLSGSVNAHGASTAVTFDYGFSPDALTQSIQAATSSVTGSTTAAVSAEVKFIEPPRGSTTATVFYRVRGVSGNGTSFGATAKATTNPATNPPLVTTLPASLPTTHESAVLNGKVNVRNRLQSADNVFEWGVVGGSVTNRTAASPPTERGDTEKPLTLSLSGLAPHTKYFFRARSASSEGMGTGKVLNFETANRNPVANDDTQYAVPNSPTTLNILANDSDPDSDVLSIKSFTPIAPAQGKLAKVGNALLFTPTATFNGSAVTFTYIAQDAFGGVSNSATVTLNLDTLAISPTSNPGNLAAAVMSYPVAINVGQNATAWKVLETSPFVTVTPMSGTGDGSVTVTVGANLLRTPRTATVMIGGQVHNINQPGVIPPVFNTAASPSPAVISGFYTYPFSTSTPPLPAPTYTATNLPNGLKVVVDAVTGAPRVEGVPEKSGSFNVIIKAVNAAAPAATAPTLPFTIVVRDLPPELVGVHTALVNANVETGLPGGLTNFNRKAGAHVNFTTTSLGSLSGTVRLGNGTKAPDTLQFRGRINAVAAATPAPISATFTVDVPRKPPLSALVLKLNFDSSVSNIITGSLAAADDVRSIANFTGWRNKWSATTPATLLVDAKNKPVKEYYTMSLTPPASAATAVPAEPLGWGYLTATLQPAGTLAWAGVLADGTAVSGASTLSPADNMFIVFAPLYQPTSPAPAIALGVLAGLPQINRPASSILGTLKWVKEAAPGVAPLYTYPNAYAHDLLVEGGLYAPPAGIIFGLTYAAGNNNAVIDFEGGGIIAPHLTSIDQTFAINPSNVAIFSGAGNPNLVKLTISKTLGLFNGTFSLADGAVKRSNIPYRGVLVQDPAVIANSRGKGHFLLPQLPTSGVSTATTPRLSGTVLLRPK